MNKKQEQEILYEIKKRVLEKEETFSKYATKSKDAFRFNDEIEDTRLAFQRDADRIIHTPSFTRYIGKTQVYSDLDNDNISKRMTHVQFVSRASRTIARALNLNEDLCEAIALGHDVGHVPFGHFGEAILNELSLKYNGKCFAHNLNSVRVFKDIEKRGIGSNLTIQVLDGIMCHNGEMVKEKYAPRNKTKEEFLSEYNECIKDDRKIKHLIPMTMEGCVVRISDIIGYIGKDIDDARKLGLFDIETVPEEIRRTLGITNDEIMHNIIMDIILNSYNKPYIQMSSQVYNQVVELKKFNYENIYNKALDKQEKEKIIEMFKSLFEVYLTALESNDKSNDIYEVFLKKMSTKYMNENESGDIVVDYIASMTDRFIEKQYEKYVLK